MADTIKAPVVDVKATPKSVWGDDLKNLSKEQQKIQEQIVNEAEAQGVDPHLALTVGWIENRFHPTGVSKMGALGPMQIMPSNAKGLGVSLDDLKDPATNIRLGVQLLKDNLDRYDGNIKASLVAYNGSPTRAAIYLRNGESNAVLKPETQNYLKQAESLYPNIDEKHDMADKKASPFDYEMGDSKDGDTGIFGDTEPLPEHIKNWTPSTTEESFKDKAARYLVKHPEVPLAGVTDAYLQKKINEAYPQAPTEEPIAPTESAGDKWNRKVVGALGPGAESSTEAAENYNLQKGLNKEGEGQKWKVTREGIIRDPLELENERRMQIAKEAMDRESPVQRVFRAGKTATEFPAKVGAFGKAKFLGPLSSGVSAANAARAYERANELEAQGDAVGAAIARANAYASTAASIPATPYVPLDVIKGVGTIGEVGLSGAEALKDLLFPYESVTKKKEVKKANGGAIPLSLKHVYFHRKKQNG